MSTIIGIITSCQLRRSSDSVPSKSKMAARNGPQAWCGLTISIIDVGQVFNLSIKTIRTRWKRVLRYRTQPLANVEWPYGTHFCRRAGSGAAVSVHDPLIALAHHHRGDGAG